MRDFNRNGKSDCHDRYMFHKGFETRMDALEKMDEPSLHTDPDQEAPGCGTIIAIWGVVIALIALLNVLEGL